MNTAAFFLERRRRANYAAFDKIMKRKGGEKPKPEDQVLSGRSVRSLPAMCSRVSLVSCPTDAPML
ncbi:MAG: hypothetical protein ACLQO1_07200 [Steroidobacteraceae bacterium]